MNPQMDNMSENRSNPRENDPTKELDEERADEEYRLACQIAALSTFFAWSDDRPKGPSPTFGLEKDFRDLEVPAKLFLPQSIQFDHSNVSSISTDSSSTEPHGSPFQPLVQELDNYRDREQLDADTIQVLSNSASQIFFNYSLDPRPQVATTAVVALMKSLGIHRIKVTGAQLSQVYEATSEAEPDIRGSRGFWNDFLPKAMRHAQILGFPARSLSPVFEFMLLKSLVASDKISREVAQVAFQLTDREPIQSIHPLTKHGDHFTLIHGTFARFQDWPEQSSDFFNYLENKKQFHEVSTPQSCFRWSGAYSTYKREKASKSLLEWRNEILWKSIAGARFETFIAHSYGADVVARMFHHAERECSNRDSKLVALSAPVTKHLVAVGDRLTDIRLSFDLVLALDGAVQRLAAFPQANRSKMNSIVLPTFSCRRLPLFHSSTHNHKVWEREGLIKMANL